MKKNMQQCMLGIVLLLLSCFTQYIQGIQD